MSLRYSGTAVSTFVGVHAVDPTPSTPACTLGLLEARQSSIEKADPVAAVRLTKAKSRALTIMLGPSVHFISTVQSNYAEARVDCHRKQTACVVDFIVSSSYTLNP
jgi:hypothetical protein